MSTENYGVLTKQYYGMESKLRVVLTGMGYCIGTSRYRGPTVRESLEYYQARRDAQYDLDNNKFTQRASLDSEHVIVPVRKEE